MVVTVAMIIPAQPNMEVKPVSFNPQPYLVNFSSSSSSSKVSFFRFKDIFSDRDEDFVDPQTMKDSRQSNRLYGVDDDAILYKYYWV